MSEEANFANDLHRLWNKFFHDAEESNTKKLKNYFSKFFNGKLPDNISYGWLQSRMGLFISGNSWLSIKKKSSDISSFMKLQQVYRALFGCESSVNFNLSRAALYYRQKNKTPTGHIDSPRALLIKLLPSDQEYCEKDGITVENKEITVEVSIGSVFADLLLPRELFENVDKYLRDRVDNEKLTEPPDYSLLERLMACRQQTFYRVLSEWTKGDPLEFREDLKFPWDHVRLAIFLLTLEYASDETIENRWMDIRDEFLARTPDELLLSSLCVLQGALYWLRLIGKSDRCSGLLNILMPPIVTEDNFKPPSDKEGRVIAMYNGLQIPPDLVAFGGTDIEADFIKKFLPALEKKILLLNAALLENAFLNIIHASKKTRALYGFDNWMEKLGNPDGRHILREKFKLSLGKDMSITNLFPADCEQLDIFMKFCRTKLSNVGKYEGRPLRFSVILGNELHLNLYFGDDSGSQSEFNFKDEDKDTFDLALTTNAGDTNVVRADDRAIARIRGNAGLFQLSDYHLFCHVGRRHLGRTLELSHVVREHPFIQKAPVGNLFSVEVQPTGSIRILQNRMEICRVNHGEWSFKTEEQVKKLREATVIILSKIGATDIKQLQKPIEILLRAIQRLRDQSHGGTMIISGSDDFKKWGGELINEKNVEIRSQCNTIISRQTPSIRNWDGLTVEEGHLEILTELLGQDGATFIVLNDTNKLQAYGKYVLYPVYRDKGNGVERGPIKVFNPKEFYYQPTRKIICEHWKENGWQDWEAMYHKWGTRHLSSVAFSALTQDKALVITISSDGDVSCFDNGCYQKELSWR